MTAKPTVPTASSRTRRTPRSAMRRRKNRSSPERSGSGRTLGGASRLGDALVGGGRVGLAEDRRAGYEQVRARVRDALHGFGVDAPIDLQKRRRELPEA